MLRASLEMWTPLEVLHIPAPGTSLVAFVDAGNVYFRDPTILATSTIVDPEPVLRIGAGLGLRLATPVGPVQVDWGINPAYFTQTWAQERGEEPWRLHLSLGSL
jgi:outer membrane protein assembly factor BamA